MDCVVLTVDNEWTPDELISHTASVLDDYGVEATFFSTHDDDVELGSHERALHPNFLREGYTEQEAFDEISELYPEATGTRSHGLYVHSGLREHYPRYDLTYESNYMMYGEAGIKPFYMYDDIVQLPIYFMDDMWLRRGADPDEVDEMLEVEGLKVLAFHPSHVYMNSSDIEFYEEMKDYYQQPEKLREKRHEGYGVTTVFEQILQMIEEKELETLTAAEAAERYRASR